MNKLLNKKINKCRFSRLSEDRNELYDIRKADKKFQDKIFNVISIYAPTHKTAVHIYNKVIEILAKAELKLDDGKTKFDFDAVENDIYKNIILFFDDKYQFKREWKAKRTTMGIMVYVRKYYRADESCQKENLSEDRIDQARVKMRAKKAFNAWNTFMEELRQVTMESNRRYCDEIYKKMCGLQNEIYDNLSKAFNG
jgi:hypothetical protein